MPVSPAEQARFDALYNAQAEATARALSRYGENGLPIFREAQRLIRDTPPGAVPSCGTGAAPSSRQPS